MRLSSMVGMTFVIMMVATGLYYYVDISVATYFHALKSALWIDLFDNITILGQAEYSLIPALMLYLYFKNTAPQKALKAGFIFVSVAFSGIVVNLIKIIAGRFRPEHYFDEGTYGFDFFHITHDMTSFPSGHSATALGAASALWILYPKMRIPLFVLGVTIMISRLVIVRHYPSDILVGAWIGVLCSYILYQKIFEKRIEDA